MNWLGLSPLQIAGFWLASSALAVWFYLHTRRRQRRKVSTLHFWTGILDGESTQRHRIAEPWALLMQLLFLLLLLVALGNLRWDSALQRRKVVIVLDNSVWSQVQPAGGIPWIAQLRTQAQDVLNSLPLMDEVLLISAEPDALPIQRFTTDRAALRNAITQLQASSSIADIPSALEIGKGALGDSERGLLVYVGPGMLDAERTSQLSEFRKGIEDSRRATDRLQFLVRPVGGTSPLHNQGITRLSVRRDAADPTLWHLLTQIKNYDAAKANVSLSLTVAGQPITQERVPLSAGQLTVAEDEFVWAGDGVLQADISPRDDLDADNHASIILPAFRPTQVALIGTDSPFSNDVLKGVVSNPYVQFEVVRPGESPLKTPDVAVYESESLPSSVAFDSIWFLKGRSAPNSPRFQSIVWNEQHPVTRWIHTSDVSVRNPFALKVQPGDAVLATIGGKSPEPLVVAREKDGHRIVIVGFDPDDSNFAQQSAFPLMIAGCMEWMSQSIEETAESFSVGEIDVPGPATRVVAPSGRDVPFATNGPHLHLRATESGIYRLVSPTGSAGESSFTVNLPILPAHRLEATNLETAGIEQESPFVASPELWRWLAIAAMIALWLEWRLYYASRSREKLAGGIRPSGAEATLNPILGSEKSRQNAESRPSNLGI